MLVVLRKNVRLGNIGPHLCEEGATCNNSQFAVPMQHSVATLASSTRHDHVHNDYHHVVREISHFRQRLERIFNLLASGVIFLFHLLPRHLRVGEFPIHHLRRTAVTKRSRILTNARSAWKVSSASNGASLLKRSTIIGWDLSCLRSQHINRTYPIIDIPLCVLSARSSAAVEVQAATPLSLFCPAHIMTGIRRFRAFMCFTLSMTRSLEFGR